MRQAIHGFERQFFVTSDRKAPRKRQITGAAYTRASFNHFPMRSRPVFRTLALLAILPVLVTIAAPLDSSLGAQRSPDYSCPLDGAPLIPEPDALGIGGWPTGGAFDDTRADGISAAGDRIMRPHGAWELAAGEGANVHAVRGGRVAASAVWPNLGNVVIVDHGDGEYAVYGLLGTRTAREGATIARGEVIGTVGFSGDGAVVHARLPSASARLHLALVVAGRSGLADAGQPLRQLAGWTDAWRQTIAGVTGPIDPGIRLPATCRAGRRTTQ
ncbi:MAG: Peptidase, family [Gemmatimonadetes bacterium]|nr:Peptidase, family [Gemmatimonadota bacterium]